MKKMITMISLLGATSALASFTCAKTPKGVYLIGSAGGLAYVSTMEECQKAVEEAVNGFTCIGSPRGIFLVGTGGKPVYIGDMQRCLDSAKNAK